MISRMSNISAIVLSIGLWPSFLAVAAFQGERKSESRQVSMLCGTWECEKVEIDGAKSELGTSLRRISFDDKHKVVISDKEKASDGGKLIEGKPMSYSLNPTKEPAELNFFGDGALIQTIYSIEDDKLKIAFYGRAEVDRPKSFEFAKDGEKDLHLIVWSFKKK